MPSLEKNLEVIDFLTEMFNNKGIEVDLRNGFKSCIKHFELDSNTLYKHGKHKNPGKEIEKMLAIAIRKNMGSMVSLRKKKDDFPKRINLIIDDDLPLSISSKEMTDDESIAKTIIIQNDYGVDIRDKHPGEENLRNHLKNLDDAYVEPHVMLFVTHNERKVIVSAFSVKMEDLEGPHITTNGWHVRKEYSLSSAMIRQKLDNSDLTLEIDLDEYSVHPEAYKDYCFERANIGMPYPQEMDELFA